MADYDKVFAGSIPRIYDSYLVPFIFEAFAEDVAQRVAALAPTAVLETAAGTGVVTRALARRLAADARYVVTDLNQPMLDHAAERQGSDSRITWRQADALSLPFDDASFDVVCCQFGVMFFPDRVLGYREAKRVLRPGGHFVFNVWDRIEENIFANEVTNALAEWFPDNPPRFLARTPHAYHDASLIHDELERAGFTEITIEIIAKQSRAPSPHDAALAYCQGTPLRNEIEARGVDELQAAMDHVATAIAKRHGSNEVSAKIQGIVVTATA
ncbi:MAG: ubiquinone/menaquinone biosynthesis methyltransferase protein [Hyphomicrobiales bacterium]|nr:ubiquinone/menaquinone biosynthesis methyltransferase protein [Hyphomicrobiales bacterium]